MSNYNISPIPQGDMASNKQEFFFILDGSLHQQIQEHVPFCNVPRHIRFITIRETALITQVDTINSQFGYQLPVIFPAITYVYLHLMLNELSAYREKRPAQPQTELVTIHRNLNGGLHAQLHFDDTGVTMAEETVLLRMSAAQKELLIKDITHYQQYCKVRSGFISTQLHFGIPPEYVPAVMPKTVRDFDLSWLIYGEHEKRIKQEATFLVNRIVHDQFRGYNNEYEFIFAERTVADIRNMVRRMHHDSPELLSRVVTGDLIATELFDLFRHADITIRMALMKKLREEITIPDISEFPIRHSPHTAILHPFGKDADLYEDIALFANQNNLWRTHTPDKIAQLFFGELYNQRSESV